MRYAVEFGLRIGAVLGLSIFLKRAVEAWITTPDLTVFLLALGEIVTVGLVLAARPAKSRSIDPIAVTTAGMATFYFLFLVLDGGVALLPLWATSALQVSGICFQIVAKFHLGRSFGVLPANRGIVTTGPYRLVRHPIYLGYLLSHIGFLFAEFTWRNLILYAALYFFQAIRIAREERLLRTDVAYRAYMERVPYRVAPGIF